MPIQKSVAVNGLSSSAFLLMTSSPIKGKGKGRPDFTPALARIHLVMTVAHLDAFLTDSVRAVLLQKPEALASGKQIEWKTLIDLGSWEAVLDYLRDSYCFEFGVKPLDQRLTHLRERLGLDLAVDSEVTESLRYSEQLRHLVLHNGGMASVEFPRKTGERSRNLKVGEPVMIDVAAVRATGKHVSSLAAAVFQAVSLRFFGVCPPRPPVGDVSAWAGGHSRRVDKKEEGDGHAEDSALGREVRRLRHLGGMAEGP